ncbi:WSC domain-containing protein [Lachnellula suecica]|uniref:Peroxidase n=1 Tax=Lachnellula suecica TaxID=602035 RepID=A0A8T9BVA2_9HELO|nr:WSC domain-containing protein [Lachnellula suecica]
MIVPFSSSRAAPLLMFGAVACAQFNGIDIRDKIEEIEHLWVDNRGTNSDGFVGGVTPCANYIGFASNGRNRGEQTSAQWVRMVFHDSVTANLAAGTGGVDASIGFESNRAENSGLFINDTLQFMRPTVNAYLSMADNIALGLVVSLVTCGGANTGIPLRAGRIDAVEAGPAGVPEPTTDLATTLAQFAAAGFNQSETIALTACGHSLGRTHYSNFPDIISSLDGGVGFDSTPAAFDSSVVNEYLEGSGLLGGPLVTASNSSDQSDLRLYISDKNITMQALSTEAVFQTQCNSLFERMLNTVPSAVILSDPISPMTWKGVSIILDISSAGVVSVSGSIRNLYTTITRPATVPFTLTTSAGTSAILASTSAIGAGSGIFGSTIYWSFNSTTTSPGTTSVNFGDVVYPVNDQIFITPLQSINNRGAITVKAAVLTSLVGSSTMTAVLYVPGTQQGSLSPKITNTTIAMTSYGTVGLYTLFASGSTTVGGGGAPGGPGGGGGGGGTIVVKALLGDIASRTVKSTLFARA